MSLVDFDTDGPVGVVTLTHPPVNALSTALLDELEEGVGAAEHPGLRAMVITGAPNFAAGADINEFQAALAGGNEPPLAGRLSAIIVRLARLPKPTLAAVRGYALGGGLELALGADFRLVAPDAAVGFPEIKLGLFPGAGGTQRLTALVGPAVAKDLIFSGRTVTADEAVRIGIADAVEDDPVAAALARARELADGPTAALAAAKRCIDHQGSLAEGLAFETEEFGRLFTTTDAAEGVAAFLEKRPPRFSGR